MHSNPTVKSSSRHQTYLQITHAVCFVSSFPGSFCKVIGDGTQHRRVRELPTLSRQNLQRLKKTEKLETGRTYCVWKMGVRVLATFRIYSYGTVSIAIPSHFTVIHLQD